MSNKFSRANFESWLRGKAPRTKVGVKNSSPLVRFLKQEKLSVSALPKWAQDFNSKLQARGSASISASAALNLLA